MEEIKLDVFLRPEVGSGKIKSVRSQDLVPAVVYGGDKPPTNIKLDRRSYEKIMRTHRGQSVVFHLNVKEGEKSLRDYAAILKSEQHHPVSDSLLHVDFQRISLTEEIEVKVPVKSKGDAIGVKVDGGSLDHILWELDIVCLPTSIPEAIIVDVTDMKIGEVIHVKDMVLPAGVKTKHDPESIVFSLVHAMKEEGAGLLEEGLAPEPVVTKEKKKEAA